MELAAARFVGRGGAPFSVVSVWMLDSPLVTAHILKPFGSRVARCGTCNTPGLKIPLVRVQQQERHGPPRADAPRRLPRHRPRAARPGAAGARSAHAVARGARSMARSSCGTWRQALARRFKCDPWSLHWGAGLARPPACRSLALPTRLRSHLDARIRRLPQRKLAREITPGWMPGLMTPAPPGGDINRKDCSAPAWALLVAISPSCCCRTAASSGPAAAPTLGDTGAAGDE